jgi:3-methyl-2-oxobutanoate hydroxymethyltransferase
MLGLTVEFNPRFVRRYAQLYDEIRKAVENYTKDIINNDFPSEEESY